MPRIATLHERQLELLALRSRAEMLSEQVNGRLKMAEPLLLEFDELCSRMRTEFCDLDGAGFADQLDGSLKLQRKPVKEPAAP